MFEPLDFESASERTIREAIERGEFDDLPGKGKPIPGAGRPDDPLWWVRGWLERQRRIDDLETERDAVERRLAEMWSLETEADVRKAVARLNCSLPAGIETLEVDQVLTTWRAMSAARRRSAPPGPS